MAASLQPLCLAITFLLMISLNTSSEAAGIATYWGQNSTEGSLVDACRKGIYDYVNLAFLIDYGSGQTPQLNLAGHSLQSSEIETCQSLGVKVFLSLGGAANLSSSEDAQEVASYIWNNFLGGQSDSRPLGEAVLDGVDFYIQAGKADFLDDLVQALSEYNTPETKLVYLSAAPECFMPDYFLDTAIRTGLFDYVWVEFFDNPSCEYSSGNTSALFGSWDGWASYAGINTLFLGVPADAAVAPTGGYIPPQVLIDQVLPFVQNYSNYGGVMVWDYAHDLNYSETIRPYVNKSQIQPYDAGIATYWGQNSTEGSLVDACRKGIYDYVNLAFLIDYGSGQTPQLNLAGHSLQSSEIETCQSLGVKVFLSLGGAANLSSSEDAQEVASYIWNNFLGGQSDSRPLGEAVLDGVDFYIQAGKADFLDDLVQALSEYNTPETKLVYLSAAPECFMPDYFLDTAIRTGLFDYVWVEFFDNPSCEYSSGNTSALFGSWDGWASYTGINTLFLGVPADAAVAPTGGYIPPQVLIDQVLPFVQHYSNFGGVMVWDYAHDLNYSETIKPYFNMSQMQYYAAI